MSQQMIDAFIEKNGTLEDWQGDKVERNTSMGFFFEGWLACQKPPNKSVYRPPYGRGFLAGLRAHWLVLASCIILSVAGNTRKVKS